MVVFILVLLLAFWLLSYGSLALPPSFPLLVFNGQTIDLWTIIIFLLVLWLIGLLPSPIREIGVVVLVLWVLSVLGIFALFPGLSGILVLLIIVGAALSLFGRGRFGY